MAEESVNGKVDARIVLAVRIWGVQGLAPGMRSAEGGIFPPLPTPEATHLRRKKNPFTRNG